MHLVPIYAIPSDTDFVFVSDFFAEDLTGGAELTLEAIYEQCPGKAIKIRSTQLTHRLIEQGKSARWVFVNFTGVPKDLLVEAANDLDYHVIECDYKYCQYRSSHLHKLTTGNDCDCHTTDVGRFMQGFFKRALSVHFMSHAQMDVYKTLFPRMASWGPGKLVVQGSTFKKSTLRDLRDMYHSTSMLTDKWAVLSGGSWIKNQQDTEQYCKKAGLNYGLIGGLKPSEFLRTLRKYHGLVFHPSGYDTNPRLTIEAKLLGLKLDLNENVQQKDEPWFSGSVDECYRHLESLPSKFWSDINEHRNSP